MCPHALMASLFSLSLFLPFFFFFSACLLPETKVVGKGVRPTREGVQKIRRVNRRKRKKLKSQVNVYYKMNTNYNDTSSTWYNAASCVQKYKIDVQKIEFHKFCLSVFFLYLARTHDTTFILLGFVTLQNIPMSFHLAFFLPTLELKLIVINVLT